MAVVVVVTDHEANTHTVTLTPSGMGEGNYLLKTVTKWIKDGYLVVRGPQSGPHTVPLGAGEFLVLPWANVYHIKVSLVLPPALGAHLGT